MPNFTIVDVALWRGHLDMTAPFNMVNSDHSPILVQFFYLAVFLTESKMHDKDERESEGAINIRSFKIQNA